VRGLVGVEAVTLGTAGAFLFLLPSGRPRRRDDEGAAAAAGADFLPLPFGWPGARFSRMPASLAAPAARGTMEVEGAAAALATRASKVFLLRLPFGRLRFRDTEGDNSSATSPFSPSVGTLLPPEVEPPREDMVAQGWRR
jgi:hypothetical protein